MICAALGLTLFHVDGAVDDVGAVAFRQLQQDLGAKGRWHHRQHIGDRLRMFLAQALGDKNRVGILQPVPDIGLIGGKGGAAAKQAVNLVRRQALFEDTLDSLSIVHQAGTLGEQVLELVDQDFQLVRGNGAQRLGRGDNALQFALREEFQQLAGNRLAHRKENRSRLVHLGEGPCGRRSLEIVEIHHGLILMTLTGFKLYWYP